MWKCQIVSIAVWPHPLLHHHTHLYRLGGYIAVCACMEHAIGPSDLQCGLQFLVIMSGSKCKYCIRDCENCSS